MITGTPGRYVVRCDTCGKTEVSCPESCRDFRDVRAFIEKLGWTMRSLRDHCRKCVAKGRA